MVLRIGSHARIPGHFLAVDDLAVGDRRAFAVTRAEVEPDAIAVQMAAERSGGLLCHGSRFEGRTSDHHRTAIDTVAHETIIERPRTGGRIDGAEIVGNLRLAGDSDPISALLPQEKLQQ